jgi:hypothetical protein
MPPHADHLANGFRNHPSSEEDRITRQSVPQEICSRGGWCSRSVEWAWRTAARSAPTTDDRMLESDDPAPDSTAAAGDSLCPLAPGDREDWIDDEVVASPASAPGVACQPGSDFGWLVGGSLLHDEGSREVPALAPDWMTPQAVTPARLPVRGEVGQSEPECPVGDEAGVLVRRLRCSAERGAR